MSLDTLLANVRDHAVLAGPLAITGTLHADGGATAHSLSGLMSPASEVVQQQQGQGLIDGRRATLMLNASSVTTAISRALHPGDEWRITSGSYAGTWVVDTANLVRGGWQRADLRWERMAFATGAQEKR